MDDDDEFGDLYTDVLRPLSAPIQSQFNPQPSTPAVPYQGKENPKTVTSLVDLNLSSDEDDENDDRLGAVNFNSTALLNSRPGSVFGFDPKGFDLNQATGQGVGDGLAGVKFDLKERVLENTNAAMRLDEKAFGNSSLMDDADIDVVVEERDDKDDDFVVKDDNSEGKGESFKIIISGNGNATNVVVGQEESKTGDFLSDQIIPGISAGGVFGGAESHGNASFENDLDSDSEDDLQIVLNDTYHGPMGMEKVGGGGLMGAEEEDDEDEDGDPLVIVADNDDPNRLMITDNPDWGGQEAGIGGDGEKKDPGDASKVGVVGGSSSMAPKTGYSNHVYHHPFPSQFKYVRPGAAPITGSASSAGATPGQVRPPGGMMIPVVGRGRGDWRPGMQNYGAQAWGSGAAGRGYGIGLEFTLPSHKTIFEVHIDNFEEKPWRLPGIDISDFFNFGMNEESWKDYCKQLEQFRLERTMQSKIRVYESGRAEQDYDPDLPPELAAATGVHDTPSENAKQGLPDDGQSDLAKGAARVRPPMPTGRAIPVGTGSGERVPSADMRKPRMSDLDVIIEIICQDSADDDDNSSQGNDDMVDHRDNDRPIQDLMDCNEFEVIRHEDNTDYIDHYSNVGNQKTVNPGRRRSPSLEPVDDDVARRDESLRLSSETHRLDSDDYRERSPVNHGRNFSPAREERREKVKLGRAHSPNRGTNVRTRDKSSNDDQKEESLESTDVNRSRTSLSPVTRTVDIADVDVDHKDTMSEEDEIVEVVKDFVTDEKRFVTDEKEESLTDTIEDDDSSKHVSKTQKKLTSHIEPTFLEEEEDSKTGRSSENSHVRSVSSKDNWKGHNNNVVEDVRVGHSSLISSNKKLDSRDEVHTRRKVQDIDRHHNVYRGREELYPHKGWVDPYSAKHERDPPRRKEIDNGENLRQQRDEIHGGRSRTEEIRKRDNHVESGSGSGSRHRSKYQEIESEKDEQQRQIRKQQPENNGGWRSSYERDNNIAASKHREREDHLKNRNDNIDDINIKRRKEETYLRREHVEREEMIHAYRETGIRRKREREDVFDMRGRRDDIPRSRKDDQQNIRLKDDVFIQRERQEWHRLKKPNEEISSRKDKGEMNGVLMRGGRGSEDNTWTSQSRDHTGQGRQKDPPPKMAREDQHTRGTQLSNNSDRRSRHRDDHASNTSVDSRIFEKKHKQNPRKSKESEVDDRNYAFVSKKNHHDKNILHTTDAVRLKNRGMMGNDENKHIVSKRSRDDGSSGDEQAEAKRGRSKLERWTSNKERDFNVVVKPTTSSIKSNKQIDTVNAVITTVPSSPSKHVLPGEYEKDGGGGGYLQPVQDNVHLDTVEKLKKRSERFKLPMPVERETATAKKLETEQIPIPVLAPASSSAQPENHGDSEVKAERPTRRRRWTSS